MPLLTANVKAEDESLVVSGMQLLELYDVPVSSQTSSVSVIEPREN